MDIVCRILTQFQLINKKEEENIKKKIKDCLHDSKGIMLKILYDVEYNKLDLSQIYRSMVVTNFGLLIAFYCFLETYDENVDITKEEKERIIVQLTIQTLKDFQIYKEKRLEENQKKKYHFSSSFFYRYIKENGINYIISSIGFIYNNGFG